MKRLLAPVCALLAVWPAAAPASPAETLAGTWECRVPGAAPTRTPPIVWFGAARADGRVLDTAVDLDGFARQVSGISDLAAESGGWLRVQPQDGAAFSVRPLGTNRHGVAAMSLRRGGTAYHCLRLPQRA
jgi:hypothetical protein